jgi:peptidoglycan hydrolase-like protein with peptidoglycan-binding domain
LQGQGSEAQEQTRASQTRALAQKIGQGGLVREGDKGPAVKGLQQLLGMGTGGQTGVFGPTTREAVERFQRSHGLDDDGIVGPKTLAALKEAEHGKEDAALKRAVDGGRVFKRGDTGPEVRAIQRTLGMGTGGQTGVLGPDTERRLKEAQQRAGMTDHPSHPLGHFGKTTFEKLGRSQGPHANTPARSLTNAQALEELKALKAQGKIDYRMVGDKVVLEGPVHGVRLRYVGHSTADVETPPLDPKMAVATARLAEWAQSRGVTQIRHRGFIGGPGSDTHNDGRALDIAGLSGVNPATGARFDHDVLGDWGLLPGRSGSTTRLNPATESGAFFLDMHGFLKTQFRHEGTATQGPGDGASFIITPDHWRPDLSSTHRDHVHVEIP